MSSPYRDAETAPAPAGTTRHALLDELVHQFSDPYAFYRELVQNSIDAGSPRVDVALRWQPSGGRGLATICVADQGSGMTRVVIEEYLLTKFRSTKEGDATKIGKFGIGFLSVLAPAPELVVVETAARGADGAAALAERWRLLLQPDLTYELLHEPGAAPGTRVVLHKEVDAEAWRALRAASREAVWRWCRHAEVEVTFVADGEDGALGGAPERVNEPLAVDAPFQVEQRAEGLTIVAGPARGAASGSFYKRGLLLEQTSGDAIVPGVAFKVVGQHLAHTLARDRVRRDAAWEAALRQLRALCRGPLVARLREEVRAVAHIGAPERDDDLAVLLGHAARTLRPRDLFFPLAAGGAVDGVALRRAARRAGAVLHAPRGSALAAALEREGVRVLSSDHARVLSRAVDVAAVGGRPAAEVFTLCSEDAADAAPPGGPALVTALEPLLRAIGARSARAFVGTVEGVGADRVAVLCDAPGRALPGTRALRSPFALFAPRTLCLNRSLDIVQAALRVAERAPATAALLCARLVAAASNALSERADRRVTEAALSGGGEGGGGDAGGGGGAGGGAGGGGSAAGGGGAARGGDAGGGGGARAELGS